MDLEISQAALTSKLHSYAEEVANLKVLLKTKETAQVNQQAQLNYYRERLKAASAGKSVPVEESSSVLQEQLTKANLRITKMETDYNSKIAELRDKCLMLENQRAEADNRSIVYQSENLRLKTALEKALRDCAALEQDVAAANRNIEELNAQKTILEGAFEDLSRAKNEVDRDLLKRHAELSNLRSNQEMSRRTVVASRQANTETRQSVENLEQEVRALSTSLNEAKESSRESSIMYERQFRENSILLDLNAMMKSRIESLEKSLAEVREEKRKLEHDYTESMISSTSLQSSSDDLNRDITGMAAQLEAEKLQNSRLRVDLRVAQSVADALKTTSAELKIAHQGSLGELDRMKSALIEKDAQLSKLSSENAALTAKVNVLSSDLGEMQGRLNAAWADSVASSARLGEVVSQNEELTRDLAVARSNLQRMEIQLREAASSALTSANQELSFLKLEVKDRDRKLESLEEESRVLTSQLVAMRVEAAVYEKSATMAKSELLQTKSLLEKALNAQDKANKELIASQVACADLESRLQVYEGKRISPNPSLATLPMNPSTDNDSAAPSPLSLSQRGLSILSARIPSRSGSFDTGADVPSQVALLERESRIAQMEGEIRGLYARWRDTTEELERTKARLTEAVSKSAEAQQRSETARVDLPTAQSTLDASRKRETELRRLVVALKSTRMGLQGFLDIPNKQGGSLTSEQARIRGDSDTALESSAVLVDMDSAVVLNENQDRYFDTQLEDAAAEVSKLSNLIAAFTNAQENALRVQAPMTNTASEYSVRTMIPTDFRPEGDRQITTENARHVANLESQVGSLQYDNARLYSEIDDMRSEMVRLREALRDAEDRSAHLSQLAAVSTHKVETAAAVDVGRIAELEEECAKLRDTVESLNNVRDQEAQWESRVSSLQEDNTRLYSEIDYMHLEMVRLREALRDAEDRSAHLSQLATVSSPKDETAETAAAVDVGRIVELGEECSELRAAVESLNDVRDQEAELESRVSSLQEDNTRLYSEIDYMHLEMVRLREALRDAEDRSAHLSQLAADSTHKGETAAAVDVGRIAELEEECAKLRDTVEALNTAGDQEGDSESQLQSQMSPRRASDQRLEQEVAILGERLLDHPDLRNEYRVLDYLDRVHGSDAESDLRQLVEDSQDKSVVNQFPLENNGIEESSLFHYRMRVLEEDNARLYDEIDELLCEISRLRSALRDMQEGRADTFAKKDLSLQFDDASKVNNSTDAADAHLGGDGDFIRADDVPSEPSSLLELQSITFEDGSTKPFGPTDELPSKVADLHINRPQDADLEEGKEVHEWGGLSLQSQIGEAATGGHGVVDMVAAKRIADLEEQCRLLRDNLDQFTSRGDLASVVGELSASESRIVSLEQDNALLHGEIDELLCEIKRLRSALRDSHEGRADSYAKKDLSLKFDDTSKVNNAIDAADAHLSGPSEATSMVGSQVLTLRDAEAPQPREVADLHINRPQDADLDEGNEVHEWGGLSLQSQIGEAATGGHGVVDMVAAKRIADLEEQCRLLRDNLDQVTSRGDLASVVGELSASESRMVSSEQDNALLHGEIDELLSENTALREELQYAHEQSSISPSDFRTTNPDSVISLTTELESAMSRINELEGMVAQQTLNLAASHEDCASLRRSLEELHFLKDDLEHELEMKNAQMMRVHETVAAVAQEQVNALQQELNSMTNLAISLKDRLIDVNEAASLLENKIRRPQVAMNSGNESSENDFLSSHDAENQTASETISQDVPSTVIELLNHPRLPPISIPVRTEDIMNLDDSACDGDLKSEFTLNAISSDSDTPAEGEIVPTQLSFDDDAALIGCGGSNEDNLRISQLQAVIVHLNQHVAHLETSLQSAKDEAYETHVQLLRSVYASLSKISRLQNENADLLSQINSASDAVENNEVLGTSSQSWSLEESRETEEQLRQSIQEMKNRISSSVGLVGSLVESLSPRRDSIRSVQSSGSSNCLFA